MIQVVKQRIYDPLHSGPRMKIVCFVSGSGTNYARIALRNPHHQYLVFTNRPGCAGAQLAKDNRHELIELSHVPYLKEARAKCGAGNVPRNSPEREQFEKDAFRLIEERLHGKPDLICLAGYDLLATDWFVDTYFPRVLNVHPGDTNKGYSGLGWVASAKAVLAGEESVRSTLFIVDKTEDGGPVLLQSRPLNIVAALAGAELKESSKLLDGLSNMKRYAGMTFAEFTQNAGPEDSALMKVLGETIQNALKVAGDWEIYPFGVGLIARGEVEIDGKAIFIDCNRMPPYGHRMEEPLD